MNSQIGTIMRHDYWDLSNLNHGPQYFLGHGTSISFPTNKNHHHHDCSSCPGCSCPSCCCCSQFTTVDKFRNISLLGKLLAMVRNQPYKCFNDHQLYAVCTYYSDAFFVVHMGCVSLSVCVPVDHCPIRRRLDSLLPLLLFEGKTPPSVFCSIHRCVFFHSPQLFIYGSHSHRLMNTKT